MRQEAEQTQETENMYIKEIHQVTQAEKQTKTNGRDGAQNLRASNLEDVEVQ